MNIIDEKKLQFQSHGNLIIKITLQILNNDFNQHTHTRTYIFYL